MNKQYINTFYHYPKDEKLSEFKTSVRSFLKDRNVKGKIIFGNLVKSKSSRGQSMFKVSVWKTKG